LPDDANDSGPLQLDELLAHIMWFIDSLRLALPHNTLQQEKFHPPKAPPEMSK
jgi:hypothetical protein